MKIQIRSEAKKYEIEVDENLTIKDLKKKIAEVEKCKFTTIKLICNAQILRNTQTIKSYGIDGTKPVDLYIGPANTSTKKTETPQSPPISTTPNPIAIPAAFLNPSNPNNTPDFNQYASFTNSNDDSSQNQPGSTFDMAELMNNPGLRQMFMSMFGNSSISDLLSSPDGDLEKELHEHAPPPPNPVMIDPMNEILEEHKNNTEQNEKNKITRSLAVPEKGNFSLDPHDTEAYKKTLESPIFVKMISQPMVLKGLTTIKEGIASCKAVGDNRFYQIEHTIDLLVYHEQLQRMNEVGLTDEKLNIKTLNENNGNVDDAITALIESNEDLLE